MRLHLPFIVGILLGISIDASSQTLFNGKSKKFKYEEIQFEDLIKRYFEKEATAFSAIEGIYSVSCVITKRSRNFLTGMENERIVERKDNYGRIAIIKDRPSSSRDYIEVSLSYREADKYPIMGEFNVLSEGGGLIYNHFEPNGTSMSFSMKSESDLVEGEHSFMDGKKTITYKISYLKIYPKASTISVRSY
jgi:hypothetical protein